MDKPTIIQSLLQIARPKILKEFRADSCIASSAIGIDVLTRLGILAEPMPVRAMVFNKPFVARIERTGVFPQGEEIKTWTKEDGSYSVGIGVGSQQPGKWAGHLVVIVEKQYLVDLSVDQASRPMYGMNFEPIVVDVEDSFFAGTPRIFSYNDCTFSYNDCTFSYNDCTFRYDAMPANVGYQSSPDWLFAGRRKNIVESTLLEMEM